MKKCIINILGTAYTIEPRNLKDKDYDGFTDNTNKLIVIRSDNQNGVGDFDFLQKKAVEARNYSRISVRKRIAM